MPFILLEQDERELMAEQASLPDRNLGLLIPVLVERRVRDAIKKQWRDDEKGDLFRFYFGESGPLSAPAVCAKLAFSIGLYDEAMLRDVQYIIRIRNAFAHRPAVKGFSDDPVPGYVRELKLPGKYPKMDPKEWTIAGKTREQLDQEILRWTGLVDVAAPRHHFLRSVEIVLTWLTIKSGHEFQYRDSKISPIRPVPHTLTHASS